jgi:hypothetical protein
MMAYFLLLTSLPSIYCLANQALYSLESRSVWILGIKIFKRYSQGYPFTALLPTGRAMASSFGKIL